MDRDDFDERMRRRREDNENSERPDNRWKRSQYVERAKSLLALQYREPVLQGQHAGQDGEAEYGSRPNDVRFVAEKEDKRAGLHEAADNGLRHHWESKRVKDVPRRTSVASDVVRRRERKTEVADLRDDVRNEQDESEIATVLRSKRPGSENSTENERELARTAGGERPE
jgi:hypothetical protein